MMSSYPIIILGAGYSGLTAAALLASEGHTVKILEAHDTLGGCASFFRIGHSTFDVGATTFGALREGQSARLVFDRLSIQPEFEHCNPGAVVRMKYNGSSSDISLWNGHDQWIAEAEKVFYNSANGQRDVWTHLQMIEQRVWSALQNREYFPPTTIHDWISLLSPRNVGILPLVPSLMQTLATTLRRTKTDKDPDFCRYLNEQLLISAQSTLEDVPEAIAAMGLTLSRDVFYPVGGMMRPALLLQKKIRELGSSISYRSRVESIAQVNTFWQIRVRTPTGMDTYTTPLLLSSIPIWNMSHLTEGKVSSWFDTLASKFPVAWGAFTMYLEVEGEVSSPSSYMQVHFDRSIPYVYSDSVFISISKSTDTKRHAPGVTTISISTHVRPSDWIGICAEEHDAKRNIVQSSIEAFLQRIVPEIACHKRTATYTGTPYTWQRYTLRSMGTVGGVPHTLRSLFRPMPPNQTPFSGLYIIGDSTYPGQGIPAVMQGAWNACSRILG